MNHQNRIAISKIDINKGQIDGLPRNPRLIRDARFKALKRSIESFPDMLSLREIVVTEHKGRYVCIGGNMRFLASKELGFSEVPAKILPPDYPIERIREFAIKDNASFGQEDWDIIANEWADLPLADWGLSGIPDLDAPEPEEKQVFVSDEPQGNVNGNGGSSVSTGGAQSEARIPLAIILTMPQAKKWNAFKESIGERMDTNAFVQLLDAIK